VRAMLAVIMASLWLILDGPTGTPAWAGKEKSDPPPQKIERQRRTLEKLKDEIRENKKHADETEKKRESALQTMQTLDEGLMALRQERHAINQKLKKKDRELEDISEQVVALRAHMSERKSSILARLRVQYMEGRLGYLKAILSADTSADFQRRVQYLSAVSKREYDVMEAYRGDMDRLEGIERRRASTRDEMLTFKRSTEKKLGEIQALKRDKHQLLASLIHEKESYERTVVELERSAARVDALVKEWEQRRRAAAIRPPSGGAGLHAFKGALQWPADGEVVSFFGRQKHPTFETYVQRKGIEIRTNEGSAIRAVMAGTVAYADWLKGYGLVLILDHANGFFSLYAHASKLLAKVGEQVQTGHVIGETGDTGLTGDSTLYFELREGADPVDPLIWLAKRR